MTIRVVLKEDRQDLGHLFDCLRDMGAKKFPEEIQLLFFDNLDDWFAMIGRPAVHLHDKNLASLSETAQKS